MVFDQRERCVRVGSYIVEHGSTIRATAQALSMSKSCVHTDVQVSLRKVNPSLYKKTRKVIDKNKAERYKRGGEALRRKYYPESEKAG